MISRHWKGITHSHEGENYRHHLLEVTFPKLSTLQGFLGASVLLRPVPEGIQFLVITRWQSLEAIRLFAGEAIETAVVPPAVQAMMVSFDAKVEHFELTASFPGP